MLLLGPLPAALVAMAGGLVTSLAANVFYGGMGLGLALVKEIAKAHAGAVSVRSELGKGSTCTVSLPVEG